jgi:predicted DNA binding CopG/RHH family protein
MKQIPEFKSDAEAEAFLEQDLSSLDFKQFKPMMFEVTKKEADRNMRPPVRTLPELCEKHRHLWR